MTMSPTTSTTRRSGACPRATGTGSCSRRGTRFGAGPMRCAPRSAPHWRRDAGRQLRGGVGEVLTDDEQLGGGAAQRELGLLDPQEVAVDRVVEVDADAAVDVQAGVAELVAAFARPPLRRGDLV